MNVDAENDPGMPPQNVLDSLAEDYRNCTACNSRPCDGCMAGGVCDRRCNCDDEESPDLTEMDYDPDEDRTP